MNSITVNSGGAWSDVITLPPSTDTTIDLSGADTFDISDYFVSDSISTSGNTLTWNQPYSITGAGYANSSTVNIDADGVKIDAQADLKIGDRSLKDFMDQVTDQLAILRPAPELESRWHQLRDLRRQYEECRQDILEKEKILSILKED